MTDIGTRMFSGKNTIFFCQSQLRNQLICLLHSGEKIIIGFEAHFKDESRVIPKKYLILSYLSIPIIKHHDE